GDEGDLHRRAWRAERSLDPSDLQDVDVLRAELDGARDRDAVHDPAVDEVLAVDRDRREHAGNRGRRQDRVGERPGVEPAFRRFLDGSGDALERHGAGFERRGGMGGRHCRRTPRRNRPRDLGPDFGLAAGNSDRPEGKRAEGANPLGTRSGVRATEDPAASREERMLGLKARTYLLVAALALAAFGTGAARAADAGTVTSGTVTSEGGTLVHYSLFKPNGADATHQVPMIFHSHGWGGSRSTAVSDWNDWLADGFGVLSFDQRGHGESTAKATVEDPEHEGQDVRALIDFVATLDCVQLDGPVDPVLGA